MILINKKSDYKLHREEYHNLILFFFNLLKLRSYFTILGFPKKIRKNNYRKYICNYVTVLTSASDCVSNPTVTARSSFKAKNVNSHQ